MIEGYTPIPAEHFGGLVTAWPPEMLDVSLMAEATNVRFGLAEVSSREGLTRAFGVPSAQAVAGLAEMIRDDGTALPVVFDRAGNLYQETVAGSGNLAAAAPGHALALPAGAWMQSAAAFGRLYLAFGNGKTGVAAPVTFDGTNLDPVTIAGPGTAIAPSDSGTAGNVAAGVRYVLVLYQTREGSLTPAGLSIGSWTAAGAKEAVVASLPISASTQVVARVVAFTVAGGSSAGPFYYIGQTQIVNGVTETSTIVDDNVATSATFNFDDAFLASSIDASDQFRAQLLPSLAGVVFSQTTQRLLWWGDPAQPTTVYCSQPSDGGVYFGDTGFFQVAEGSGRRVTAVWEQRNMIYVGLDDGIYLVTPNDGDPATWSIQQITPTSGVVGPRAVAVTDGYSILVHRSGVQSFDGGVPTNLSDELIGASADRPGIWERVNWAQAALIWVHIDAETKTVRIGVPLDGAAVCSHILKVSYLDGWERSIRFSPFTARYHYFPGRRWSLDEIGASQATWLHRPAAVAAIAADRRYTTAQVVVASAGADGSCQCVDPGSTSDNGVPFRWAFRTGAVSAAELLKQQRQGMELVGLVQVRARGTGRVAVESCVDRGDPRWFMDLDLADRATGDYRGVALAQGEAVGLRFSAADGAAIRMTAMYAFAKPTWTMRP